MIAPYRPCEGALAWASGYTSPEMAWRECIQGDWMLWIIGKVSGGTPYSDARKRLVLCACECSRMALPYPEDMRLEVAIDTIERWARGDATTEELREVRAIIDFSPPLCAVCYSADSAIAESATFAALSVAGARGLIGRKVFPVCADIVRKHYPDPPIPERNQ